MSRLLRNQDGQGLSEKTLAWGLACLFLLSCSAYAETIIGKKARSYIKDLKQRLTGTEYYAVVLERRDPDASNANRFDAVIFSRLGPAYKSIRRLNQDHALIMNAPAGQQAARVTAENFAYYERLIRENSMDPEVILDKDGRELLIMYCGLDPCRVITRRSANGELSVEVRKYLLQPERGDVLPRVIEPAVQ